MNRITVIIIMVCSLVLGQTTDLFFSEYAEGSSNNKYVEIYNGTGADVDLSSYSVQGTNNGTSWGDGGDRDVSLTGTLASGDVYILAADAADASILAQADTALAYESPMHHNGDDGIALLKNGTIIDVIGVELIDPGTAWDVAGVTEATKDHTLVRKSTVENGNTDWTASAGTSASDSEWRVHAKDTWDFLGSHPHQRVKINDLQSGFVTEGDTVIVNGTVTAGSGETPDGSVAFYMQDGTGEYSGINVYISSSSGLSVNRGDSIQVTGTYTEYYGKTEIDNVDSISVISTGVTIPDPEVLTLAQADTEPWEGVLIQVQNVTVITDNTGYGEWEVTDGTDTLVINNAGNYSYEPTVGVVLKSITGPLNYSFDEYKIIPRDDNDIAGPPSIADISIDPTSPTDADDVTVSATITDEGSVASAKLTYNSGTTDTDVTMTNTTGDTYAGTIPAQVIGTTVTYSILAVDNDGDSTITEDAMYIVFPPSGTITPIYDIQYVSDPSTDDGSPLEGVTLTISGVVTAEFWGSSGNRSLYIQDAEGPWNGIYAYENGWDSFDFTTSTGTVHSVAEGDSVTLTGTIDEYFGLTEILDVSEVIIHGPAVNMISPSLVTPGQVMTDGADAEAYEGCLVKVENVTVDDPDLGNGEWSITDGTNSMRVDDNWDYYYFPDSGQALAEVSGVMTYTYSDSKLLPRLARDVIEADGAPVRLQRIQQVLYSDLIKTSEDSESDISYMYGDTVTVEGIVTMPTGLSYAGAGIKFIFQDENGGPWSSILSYDPDSSAFPVLYEGDRIRATGYVFEYNSAPSNMTELFITQPVDIIDFGVALPEPAVIQTGDLRWPTEAEQWGTVTVKILESMVTNNDLQYEVFEIDDGTGGALVDDDSDSIATYYDAVGPPPVGSYVSSIQGWIYNHYGSYGDSSTYKIEPLYVQDIEFGAGPPTVSDLSRDPCTPSSTDAVTVTAVIVDNSTIASAEIMYAVNGGTYSSVSMTLGTEDTWSGTIPASGTDGAVVDYYISGTDDGSDQDSPKTSTFPYDIEISQLGYITYADGGINDISDIQYTSWPGGDTPYNGCEVTVTGIITADTAQYNSGYAAYALQNVSEQWSGIVFDGWDDTELTIGDEVTITGTVEEYDAEWHYKYDNNTKLINISSLTTNSTGNSIVPMSVSTADLAGDADEVEAYEGCLVTVSDVTVSVANAYDWSVVDDSGIECLIDDDMANMAAFNFMSGLAEGTTLTNVTGIFNFSFGTYKIQVRDLADLGGLGVNDDFDGITREFALYPNYPNPFNPETRIRFQLAKHSDVKLMIYDILGRRVRTLVSNKMDAGYHVVNWNGLNDQGVSVASGMYVYRIKADDFIAHRKMLLVR